MSGLWYDRIKTSAQMEAKCREEPSLVSYSYGEDLQVLRERIADLEQQLAELAALREAAQDVADQRGVFATWSCSEAGAIRAIDKLKALLKERGNV